MRILDIENDEEISSYKIGRIYQGKIENLSLFIKILQEDKHVSEIKVEVDGRLVYYEDESEIKCFIEDNVWESGIERIYELANKAIAANAKQEEKESNRILSKQLSEIWKDFAKYWQK